MFCGARDVEEALYSPSWPHTLGHINLSTVVAERRGYDAQITYGYEVGGRAYTNSVVAPGQWWSTHSAFAVTDRFPQGTKVPVSYSSADPSQSLLEPGVHPATFDTFLVGLMLVAAGFPFAMGPLWRNSEILEPSGSMTFVDGSLASAAFLTCLLLFFGCALALFAASFW